MSEIESLLFDGKRNMAASSRACVQFLQIYPTTGRTQGKQRAQRTSISSCKTPENIGRQQHDAITME
jgi:hypothetical protein